MTVKKLNIKKVVIAIVLILIVILVIVFGFKKYVDDKKEKETYEYKFGQIRYSLG